MQQHRLYMYMYLAASLGHVQVVEALADAGAELGWKDSDYGRTALHVAAGNGHAGAVRSLAARGGPAAVDARNKYNRTPLHRAAMGGSTAAAQELLEAGADASLTSNNGQTALDLAVRNRKPEVAALLRLYDEVRRLCGARQRLAFATAMLPTTGATEPEMAVQEAVAPAPARGGDDRVRRRTPTICGRMKARTG